MSRLAGKLRAAAPEAWKECRLALREAAKPVLATAQANVSYSSRIPQTGRIRVTGGGNVKITFGGDSAPDAPAIENQGRGFVRHKVFGQDVWTSKNSHPAWLAPALDQHSEAAAAAIEAAVMAAVDHALEMA